MINRAAAAAASRARSIADGIARACERGKSADAARACASPRSRHRGRVTASVASGRGDVSTERCVDLEVARIVTLGPMGDFRRARTTARRDDGRERRVDRWCGVDAHSER